jgi:succinate dehydrogenase / fumarate reductase cytochrome b subunit
MLLTQSSVGRKFLMAVTGLLLLLFVVVHLVGNATFFGGPDWLNAYAKHLHDLGPFVWVFRLVMLALIAIHIAVGVQLTLENRSARLQPYSVKENLRSTFSSRTMIISGLVLLAFLVYHLLHFTAQIVTPFSAKANLDALGRPDVYTMVKLSFHQLFISLVYVVGMIFLFLHLGHGVQSFFQSLGLTNDRTFSGIGKFGTAVAIVLLVGYVSIVIFGAVNG